MTERWFFALWPDAPTRAALSARLMDLAPAGVPPIFSTGARMTHPDDLHLTLAFLGPLSSETLCCVESAADRIQCAPFELTIDRLGHFARARALWCGPSAPPQPLLNLVTDLKTRLGACGLPDDPRPYRAHITLARHALAPASAAWSTPLSWRADELVLAAGDGVVAPRYRIRCHWPLTAQSA